MLALGFHLGHNLLMTLFYESTPYGELVFVELSKTSLIDWSWLFYNLIKGFFPSIVTLIFVKMLVKSNFRILKTKRK